jgi:heme/copper-type cytochrome/quinol oxidase subunit 2
MKRTKGTLILALVAVGAILLAPATNLIAQNRVVDIFAEQGKFRVPGQKTPVLEARPGETLKLRITSKRGTEVRADGVQHTFTAPALLDQGWDLQLKEGTQDFTLKAPRERGEYTILCLAQCGDGHDQMKMKLVVR